MKISFKELNERPDIATIISSINPNAKNSRLSSEADNTIKIHLGVLEKSHQIRGFCITYYDNKTSENSAQQAFVDLAKFLCQSDEYYTKLKAKNWFYSKENISNIKNISKRYGYVRDDNFIFKDCEVALLVAKAIRLVLDCNKLELDKFYFIYDVKDNENNEEGKNWWPSIEEYNPNISKEKWLELLNDELVFTDNAYRALASLYDFGGIASCRQLEEAYGRTSDYYRASLGVHAANKVKEKLSLSCYIDERGNQLLWPILFQGREASSDEAGNFVWKIRQELFDALSEFRIARFLIHQAGTFDSWEIIDEVTAIKTCDKSFFEHNGSGVPKGICWYFDSDNTNPGDRIDIKLEYEGNTYNARVSNESSDRRRVRIFWSSDLGEKLKTKRDIEGIRFRFRKEAYGKYNVDFITKSITSNPSKTNTWLLTWNPKNWEWKDFDSIKSIVSNGGEHIDEWACSNSHAKIGDRVFLTMLGMGDDNGIFASGIVVKEPYQAPHYEEDKKKQGVTIQKINVRFDVLLDYKKEQILKQTQLERMFPEQRWNPQASGIMIKEEYQETLEEEWAKLTRKEEINTMTNKEIIDSIKSFISSQGFTYPDNLVENFYLSLKSKPFVILAGTSGTGKTRLVRLFAEAINAEYKLVPVRPDWSDSSDLFGHVNLNDKFVPGAIIDFIKEANDNPNKPFILCLDEMNLARVEYYLSDFLSIIETRDMKNGTIVTDPLITIDKYGMDTEASDKYGELSFPENLYVIGTVNMDETTFPFSKKVLDRANTIEFNYVDLIPSTSTSENSDTIAVNNHFLRSDYLKLIECTSENDFVNAICTELQSINMILQKANLHIGYRVRDEILFYLLNNKKAEELITQNEAFDNQFLQKILPRIQGSSESIRKMLCDLFKRFAGDYTLKYGDSDSEKMSKILEDDTCKYPKSAAKIQMMISRFEDDGFTSYWL